MKKTSLACAAGNERRRIYGRLALLILAFIVSRGIAGNAQEKLGNFTYSYPQETGADPYPAQQDGDFRKLIDGKIGTGGDSAVWGSWDGLRKIVVLVDLQKKYMVDQVKIWTTESAAYHHIGSLEIYASDDGQSFQLVRSVTNPNPKLAADPPEKISYAFGQSGLAKAARYIKLVVTRDSAPGVRSQIFEEIELWGQEIPLLKTMSLSQRRFAPQKGQLSISYEASDEVRLSAEIFAEDGARVAVLAEDQPASGAASISWDGKNSASQLVGVGTYVVQLTASKEAQQCVRTASVEVVSPDLPLPIIETNFVQIVNEPEITLTASTLPGLTLEISLNGAAAGSQLADARGQCVFKVENLQVGINEVKVRATDEMGNESQEATFPAVTYDPQAAIGQVLASPNEFAPTVESTRIEFYLAEAMPLGVRIKSATGAVRELSPLTPQEAGLLHYNWDGKDVLGLIVADGNYLVEVFSSMGARASCKVAVRSRQPGKPYLLLPENHSSKSESFVDFIWENSAGAREYQLSFWPAGKLEEKQTVTTYEPNYHLQISADLLVGQWEWQVVAVSGANLTAASDKWTFTVDWRQPGAMEVRNFQLAPNPFSPTSGIFNRLRLSYTLTQGATVKAAIYNLAGKLVYSFKRQFQGMGDHLLVWDGRAETGRLVGKGVYVLLLTVENNQTRGKATTKRIFSVMY